MILSALGTAILIALAFWLFGGLALRIGGALLLLAGAVGLAGASDAGGLLLVALGATLWWAGHLHYALRRGAWKSVLAQRLFDGLVYAWERIGQKAGAPSPGADLRAPADRATAQSSTRSRAAKTSQASTSSSGLLAPTRPSVAIWSTA